jgi:membrane protein YdbS with pleckstrin-like domain
MQQMERLDPRVLILFFIKNFLATFYIIPIWFISVSIFESVLSTKLLPETQIIYLLYGAGIIFSIFLFVASYYWAWLTFSNYSYALENDGLHIRRGFLLQREDVLPYGQIQSIEVYINPLVARFLELYSLKLTTRQLENTAGVFKRSANIIIPGLTPVAAKYLRDELIKLSHVTVTKKTFIDPTTGRYRYK